MEISAITRKQLDSIIDYTDEQIAQNRLDGKDSSGLAIKAIAIYELTKKCQRYTLQSTPNELEWVPAEIRTSFKYNDGWAHEDSHEYTGWSFAIVASEELEPAIDDEGYSIVKTVITSKPVNETEFKSAMRVNFLSSCSCEHDCCGHYNGGFSSAKHVNACVWEVTASYYPNI